MKGKYIYIIPVTNLQTLKLVMRFIMANLKWIYLSNSLLIRCCKRCLSVATCCLLSAVLFFVDLVFRIHINVLLELHRAECIIMHDTNCFVSLVPLYS